MIEPRAAVVAVAAGLAAGLAAAAGCGTGERPGGAAVATVSIRGHQVLAELAVDPETQERGLALRERLPADRGMLFVLPDDASVAFWMKDTFMPLAIAFLDGDGVILAIEHMEPFDEVTRYTPGPTARYALEVNDGWFDERGIGPGDRADLPVLGGLAP